MCLMVYLEPPGGDGGGGRGGEVTEEVIWLAIFSPAGPTGVGGLAWQIASH